MCTPIVPLRDKNVRTLAAGCYHSIIITANGKFKIVVNVLSFLLLLRECCIFILFESHTFELGFVFFANLFTFRSYIFSLGMLYVFGRNNHGQLATGDTDERHSPHPVDNFIGMFILHLFLLFSNLTIDDEC